jgi:HAD superfamily hydrolase (TIGR01450 family)
MPTSEPTPKPAEPTSGPASKPTSRPAGLLLLVDLDGVLYRGAAPVPGVAAVLAARAAAGDDVVYVTNNSMWYRAEYVERIAGLGAPVSADRIVSSPRATALYLVEHEPSIRHVLTVGAAGMDRELEDAGFRVTRAGDIGERIRGGGVEGTDGANGWEAAGRPDAVVVGLDPAIDYLRLAVATDCVRAGARFIATNRDPVYPTERAVRPGAGSIVAAVEAATGVTPISIGKPEPYLLIEAAHAVGRDPGEAIMIGDGLGTDIAAAIAVGARSVLMLTGVTTLAALDAVPEAERPTAVAANAAELAAILERLSLNR